MWDKQDKTVKEIKEESYESNLLKTTNRRTRKTGVKRGQMTILSLLFQN